MTTDRWLFARSINNQCSLYRPTQQIMHHTEATM